MQLDDVCMFLFVLPFCCRLFTWTLFKARWTLQQSRQEMDELKTLLKLGEERMNFLKELQGDLPLPARVWHHVKLRIII